jgi:hypothetical protein
MAMKYSPKIILSMKSSAFIRLNLCGLSDTRKPDDGIFKNRDRDNVKDVHCVLFIRKSYADRTQPSLQSREKSEVGI